MLFDMAVDKEVIKAIKTDFFALRNGEVASRLRKAGSPYKIIFGLLVPQLEQIAASVVHTSALAEALWKNNLCSMYGRAFLPRCGCPGETVRGQGRGKVSARCVFLYPGTFFP